MAARNLRDVGDQVEALLAEFGDAGDAVAAERAEQLVRLLMELYGGALERVMDLVAGAADPTITDRLAEDPLVASLLVLHGLHPVPVEQRVLGALAGVRKYTGDSVRFIGIEDGMATFEIDASAGCTAVTARTAVEEAVAKHAPDIVGVEFKTVFPAAAEVQPVPVSIGPPRAQQGGGAVPVSIGSRPATGPTDR
jgi:hypothetical protein